MSAAPLSRAHELAAGVAAEVRPPLRFLSVCSGIEAASVALEPLGFTPVGFAEIDKAASALLGRHFPHVRNFGDFTEIDPREVGPVDWLIGGTPCQAFSIAGKRLSLADARGNLTLAYVVLAHELARSNGLRGALWENVPGVLNTPDNAFGCFLAALVGSERALIQPRGTGWPNTGMVDGPRARAAWIVRDAQYFGLAQRRERVFVVASFGDGIDPAQILFERASLSGNPAPRREARERVAPTIAARTRGGGGYRNDADTADNEAGDAISVAFGGKNQSGPIDVSTALNAHGGPAGRLDFESETFITHASDGTGRGTPIVPCAFDARQSDVCVYGERTAPLDTDGFSQAVAFDTTQITSAANYSNPKPGDPCHPLAAGAHPPAVFLHTNKGRPAGRQSSHTEMVTIETETIPTLTSDGHSRSAVAFDLRGRDGGAQFEGPHETANIRAASGGSSRSYIAQVELQNQGSGGNRGYAEIEEPAFTLNTNGPSGVDNSRWAVRRLLPIECERLQGFPDGWTECQADGPRYRQLGNSMAVPVIRWIGERILASEAA